MTDGFMDQLADAYERRGVKALAAEAERVAPPQGSADSHGSGWVEALVGACDDARLAVPATWLLLERGKAGAPFTPQQVTALGRRLAAVTEPNGQLHLCQLVRFLEVPNAAAASFGSFLESSLRSPRPFVRAWAIDGLRHLAAQHPSFSARASAALQAGADDPAASVRARVRRIHAGD